MHPRAPHRMELPMKAARSIWRALALLE